MNNASEQSICILGRQPELGLAELESLYGAAALRRVSEHVVCIKAPDSSIVFARLGGSTRLARIVSVVQSSNWKVVEKELASLARKGTLSSLAIGKLHLGISAYGFSLTPAKIQATALTLKKMLRSSARSVRVVPNTEVELNTAQVLHNQLATDKGVELLVVADGARTIIAKTTAAQDIDSYTLRDRGRPKRDARVGMLPPKLAQIIINLAVGPLNKDSLAQLAKIPARKPVPHAFVDQTILDPFCGTGVLLQEAMLMGYEVIGTDLEPRMITYSKQNLAWISEQYQRELPDYTLEAGDATSFDWGQSVAPEKSAPFLDFVACETYLGRPFTTAPPRDVLEQTVSDVNVIVRKFLANIYPQLEPGTRLCLAVPAWQLQPNVFRHLPVVDSLEEMGYNQLSFEHVLSSQLLYYREDQIVARELLVLTRK